MSKEIKAVLLLAHGSPDSMSEVPEFLRKVTGGRTVPEPVVKEVTQRYRLIGRSPLTIRAGISLFIRSRTIRINAIPLISPGKL